MPEGVDRTDIERVRAKTDRDIIYDEIPPLDDPVWTAASDKPRTRLKLPQKRRA
jgi:hypothetical protein